MTEAQCNMILGLHIATGQFVMPYYTTWERYAAMFNFQTITAWGTIRAGL